MDIGIRGVVQTFDAGHKYVHVVVSENMAYLYKKHLVGVDIKVNRGRIITFLSGIYGIPPGKIGWPDHIILKEEDD